MSSVTISDHSIVRDLDFSRIPELAGAILATVGGCNNELGAPVDVICSNEIILNQAPKNSLIKMALADHVDEFFEFGKLSLGCFKYFNTHEHSEVKDEWEGKCLLVGIGDRFTSFTTIHGGFNHYVFCTYDGDPDPECLKDFGYDSHFCINDPVKFANAVQRSLNAHSFDVGKCLYSDYKVVSAEVKDEQYFCRISAETQKLGGIAKYFVKTDKYSHQCEYRFIWTMNNDIVDRAFIYCPEAVQYCSRS